MKLKVTDLNGEVRYFTSQQFSEYKYTASGLTGFDAFQIKIVMKGSNQAYPPRIKDMRGIALAL